MPVMSNLGTRERLLSGGTEEDETVASHVHKMLFLDLRTMHYQELFCLSVIIKNGSTCS